MRMPGLFPFLPELGRSDVRELTYRNYRVIYRIDAMRILILTVRHWRPEPDAMLEGSNRDSENRKTLNTLEMLDIVRHQRALELECRRSDPGIGD